MMIDRFDSVQKVNILRLDNTPAFFGKRHILIGTDLQIIFTAIGLVGIGKRRKGRFDNRRLVSFVRLYGFHLCGSRWRGLCFKRPFTGRGRGDLLCFGQVFRGSCFWRLCRSFRF